MTDSGRPVRTPSITTCGRRGVLDFVLNAFNMDETRLVVLAGARLDGKTSLLRWLARAFPDRYTGVYVNPVTWPPLLPNEVVSFIARSLAQSLRLQKAEQSGFSDAYFKEADELLGGGRLVLLLDELPVESLSEGSGGSSRDLLADLREIMARWPSLFAVVGLGKKLHEADAEFLGGVADARVRYLSPLFKDEMLLMAADASVHLTGDGLQRVEELTNGQPSLVTWLCGCLAEYVRWRGKDTLDAADVEQVLDRAMVGEDVGLVRMWQSLDFAERVLLIVIAHSETPSQRTSSLTLQRALSERGIRLAGVDLPAALDRLVEMGFLRRKGPSDDYALALEAFHRWVKVRFPLGNLREALEKMNPRATEEFAAARDVQLRGKIEDAATKYRQVLEINPNHCSAWLGLAQTLSERSAQVEAIEAFERAYELDRVLSRDGLTAALLSQARALQSQGLEGPATRALGRVLEVSPEHEPARQNLLLLLGQRAEAFAQRGDMERARESFREMLEIEPADHSVTARLAELNEQRASGLFAGPRHWGAGEWRTFAGLGVGLCALAVALFAFSRGGFGAIDGLSVGSATAPASVVVAVAATATPSPPVPAPTDTPPSAIQQNETATLTSTPQSEAAATLTIADTPTPAATDTPLPTDTSTASPTPQPTQTPAPARPSPTKTPAPTRTPLITATSTTTPTPTPSAAMPVLLEPATGSYFSGSQTRFELRWMPVGLLEADEWYGLSVRYMHNSQLVETGAWLKETHWVVPEYLAGQADEPERKYQWDVVVVKELPPKPDGSRTGREISRRSETRTFVWR